MSVLRYGVILSVVLLFISCDNARDEKILFNAFYEEAGTVSKKENKLNYEINIAASVTKPNLFFFIYKNLSSLKQKVDFPDTGNYSHVIIVNTKTKEEQEHRCSYSPESNYEVLPGNTLILYKSIYLNELSCPKRGHYFIRWDLSFFNIKTKKSIFTSSNMISLFLKENVSLEEGGMTRKDLNLLYSMEKVNSFDPFLTSIEMKLALVANNSCQKLNFYITNKTNEKFLTTPLATNKNKIITITPEGKKLEYYITKKDLAPIILQIGATKEWEIPISKIFKFHKLTKSGSYKIQWVINDKWKSNVFIAYIPDNSIIKEKKISEEQKEFIKKEKEKLENEIKEITPKIPFGIGSEKTKPTE